MKTTLTLLAVCLLIGFGCTSDAVKNEKEIENLETALEGQSDPGTAEALINAYDQYIAEHPENIEQNARYQYRAASLLYRMNQFPAAADRLQRAIRAYYPAENTPNNILLLASVYEEKLRMPASALTAYQAFAQAFPNHQSLADLEDRLTDDLPPLSERLQGMRREMYDDSTGRIDFRLANDFITSAQIYANILPEDPKSPEFLHLAGETARSVRDFDKALQLYEWISTRYPDHARAPQALFLRAFILDNDLKQFDKARALYEDFLAKYPNDDFADDTQFLLDNLGKDDEEIINSFLKEEETQ